MAEHDVVVSLKISMDNGCRREGIIVAACPRLIQEVPFFEGYIYIYLLEITLLVYPLYR